MVQSDPSTPPATPGPNSGPGDSSRPGSTEDLFALLYRELHVLAERNLRRQGARYSLGATTLLHEFYLNVADRADVRFPDRAHFLGYASRAMRGLIIDYARRRFAAKRGGEFQLLPLDHEQAPDTGEDAQTLAELSEAIDQLAALDPGLAELVDLHFFCGLSFVEIAGLRGVSERTVQRDWRKARLVLHREMRSSSQEPLPET